MSLSWTSSNQRELSQSGDGSQIFTCDDKAVYVRTTEQIPIDLSTYSYEVQIKESGNDYPIRIGFVSNIPEIGNRLPEDLDDNTVGIHLNDKAIHFRGIKTVEFEGKVSAGDVIGCHLMRIIIEDVSYAICEFHLNGEFIGDQLIQQTSIYPCMWVTKSTNKVILKPNLGETTYVHYPGI